MILIATIQLYHSHTTNFTKWRGGGFGMYSEISWQNREVWFREVPVKSNYVDTYSEKLNLVRRNPTNKNMKKVANHIAKKEKLDRFIFEVWDYEYSIDNCSLTKKKLNEITYQTN